MATANRIRPRAAAAPPADALNQPRPVGVPRETVPAAYNPNARGGLGIIPRRGVQDTRLLQSRASLIRMAGNSPLRLLALLPEIAPAIGYATWMALRLTCDPTDCAISAVRPGAGEAGHETEDSEGTAAIQALFDGLPNEVGGFGGLMCTLTLSALYTGLVVAEGVPGARLRGLARIWPVDSLSIYFGRDDADGDVVAYQRQVSGAGLSGYTRLNATGLERVPWRVVDNFVDDPYGRAPYAAALAEVLADVAMTQDLRDSIHHSAWPRGVVGFNFENTYKIATEIMGISNPQEAATWVHERFQETVRYVEDLKADDWIVMDTSGEVSRLPASGFSGLNGVLAYLRHRIVQGVKSLPTLMGINDGSTQTYTSVEWAIYAKGLETVRSMALGVLLKLCDLHLRLLGMPMKAKADPKPIKTSDALADAQTEQLEIANAVSKRDQGWISNEEASIEVTGSGPVAEPAPAPVPTAGPAASPADTGEEPPAQSQRAPEEDRAARIEALKRELQAKYLARRLQWERSERADMG